MDHYEFSIPTNAPQQEVLIALLSDIGFTGFEESADNLRAYVPVEEFQKEQFETILSRLELRYTAAIVAERNWNAEWESGFQPVIIPHPDTGDPYLSIRADFHLPDSAVPMEIVITPKMSFGTGHHATTWMMVQLMSKIDFAGKYVIDFGTGTGVLAILAEKLGARSILAIDNDQWSIENAGENIAANSCKLVELKKADSISSNNKADVVLANINLNVILDQLDKIKITCLPGATVLFSGILVTDRDTLTEGLTSQGFTVKGWRTRGQWASALTTCTG